jgi:pyruvate kinase
MLESMRENPRPLRSEVTDIVNAVREGADMVMLSGETADGKYPIKSTETMADILREAEEENRIIIHETTKKETTKEDVIKFIVEPPSKPIITTTEAIASPACGMAKIIDSPAIIVCAATGMTAKKCANFRPKQSIIAITRVKETAINLLLYRGVYPVLIKYQPDDTEELLGVIEKILEILDIGKEGDLIVSTFGAEVGVKPLSTTGELKTNTMRILKRGK